MQLFISHVVQLAQLPAAAYAAIILHASSFAGHPSLTAVGLSATAVALALISITRCS